MALAFFLFTNILVILFGLGFVFLTLKHHRKVALDKKTQEELAALQRMSEEKHI